MSIIGNWLAAAAKASLTAKVAIGGGALAVAGVGAASTLPPSVLPAPVAAIVSAPPDTSMPASHAPRYTPTSTQPTAPHASRVPESGASEAAETHTPQPSESADGRHDQRDHNGEHDSRNFGHSHHDGLAGKDSEADKNGDHNTDASHTPQSEPTHNDARPTSWPSAPAGHRG